MPIRSTDSLLWSCAPDAPAFGRCHLAVHKPTRIDWLCWNGMNNSSSSSSSSSSRGGGGGGGGGSRSS